MLNNASKFALGVAGIAVIAAIFADDRAGLLVLVGAVLAAGAIAFGVGRTVGADLAPFAEADSTPASTALDPTDVGRASFGPLLAAIGATVAVAGGALGPYWVVVGLIAAVVGGGVWLIDAYRTPGTLAARDAANVDTRLLGPLALPVVSFLVAITIAYAMSRVLLAVNETASWVIAFVVAAVLLGILAVVAEKRPQGKVLTGLAGAGAVVVLVSGVTFAGVGEREFHHAGEELPTVEITAKDIAFDRNIIALPAESEAEMIFHNLDIGTYHNVAIYTAEEPGTPIYNGQPSADGTLTYKFDTPAEGTYRFICDFHPAMAGEFRATPPVAADDGHGSEADHGSDDQKSDDQHEGESPKAEADEPSTPVTTASPEEGSEH